MQLINKNQLIGRKIAGVFRSAWRTIDRFTLCDLYIKLDNNLVFRLPLIDDIIQPITETVLPELAVEISKDWGESCVNDVVIEIVQSNYWISIGLLLSSHRFLFLDCGPSSMEPCLTVVGKYYTLEDVRVYPSDEPVL